ncbi:hypothetical protein BDW62DRAFT_201792 [Aspergillus aurantiobrunneus]
MKDGEISNAATTSVAADPDQRLQSQNQDPRARDLLNSSKRSFLRLLHPRNLVGFLWLGPSLAILILNFRGHIIGAGLNCGSHCRIDPYSTSQVEQIERLDGTNRDVLGALQFVAKGLEVWFMYVAAGFVYRLALHLSAKDNRLPVSLLLVFAEFMDLLYIKDLAVKAWDLAMEKNRNAANPAPADKLRSPRILYVFMLVVAALSVIANLMGVATATLVIPGLQWIDINRDESIAFGELLSSGPPRDDNIARCREGQLENRAYSCTENLYGASLDELVEAAVASERQFEARQAVLLPPVSQEGNMSFSANVSESADIRWTASRQLLRDFGVDLANYYAATTSDIGPQDHYPDSRRFNQSLQTQLQRVGPTIGLSGGCWLYGAPAIFNVSSDREVRCYAGFSAMEGTITASKCISWGSGWNDDSASASFTILDSINQLYDMGVTVYSTPRARYLQDQTCLENNSCDWDRLFSDPPDPLFRNVSDSQQTYEYSMPQYSNDSAIWCDNTAFLSFAAYALNPSPVSNLLQLVQIGLLRDSPGLDDEPSSRAAILTLHPDWTLAACASYRPKGSEPRRFNLIHNYAVMQAVSLIPYTTTSLSTAADRSAQRQREADSPYTQATLTSWATVQLWKYGIDSRTKRLGAVVLIMGMVIVLATAVLWFEAPKSPTQIIVNALIHQPPEGELRDAESGAPLTARFKYPMLTEEDAGQQVARKKHRRTSSFGFSYPGSPGGSPVSPV